jgi:hypothetical protein
VTEYDPQAIQKCADGLYTRARSAVASYTALGTLLGALASIFLRAGAEWLIAAAILGAAVGYVLGSEKAFQLRLQAQMSLCQVRIEANTRKAQSQLPST